MPPPGHLRFPPDVLRPWTFRPCFLKSHRTRCWFCWPTSVLGGLYLVVVPLALYAWMNQRWHRMGKLERLGIYGLVFLFFPGMILFAPFLNFRLSGQGDV